MAKRFTEDTKSLDDVAKKGLTALLGTWLLIHEKADDLIRAAISKSGDKPEEDRDFVDRLTVEINQEKEILKKKLEDSLAEAINAPHRSEIEKIKERLAGIEERLRRLEEAAGL